MNGGQEKYLQRCLWKMIGKLHLAGYIKEDRLECIPTGDDINFIISGKGRAVCDGKAEQLIARN